MDGVLSHRLAIDSSGIGRAGNPRLHVRVERLFLGAVPHHWRRGSTHYRGGRRAQGPVGDVVEPGLGGIDTGRVAIGHDVLCDAAALRCRADVRGNEGLAMTYLCNHSSIRITT